jgi:DNA-binding NtrC family response regulator
MAPELKRLLFVDDEPSIRAMLPNIFSHAGFAVTTAGSVEEALERIYSQGFDVLVTDVKLDKDRGGFKLVRTMRQLNPRCVNVILTGYPEFSSAVEGIREGVDDFFTKPAEPDSIIRSIEAKLQQRRPKARILSVSYDEPLMRTRQMLLQTQGYQVTSSQGFSESLAHCRRGGFDLFILGHSIPLRDKAQLIKSFHEVCKAPIISLRRSVGEKKPAGADYQIDPDPEDLLRLVAEIVEEPRSLRRA